MHKALIGIGLRVLVFGTLLYAASAAASADDCWVCYPNVSGTCEAHADHPEYPNGWQDCTESSSAPNCSTSGASCQGAAF